MTDDVAVFSPRLRREERVVTMADVEVLRYGPMGEVVHVITPVDASTVPPPREPAAAEAPVQAKPSRPKLSERAIVKQAGKP